jgi:OHCU decarboxylase
MTNPSLAPIPELNGLSHAGFVEALRPLLEAAGPLGDALFARRPYASYDQLLERASSVAASLPDDRRIATVNAHPRIGESAAVLRQTSARSYGEQGHDAPTSSDTANVDARLAELNQAYEARFGFRFVIFVNRRPRGDIIPILEARLTNAPDQELDTAVSEMLAIARDRLRSISDQWSAVSGQ